jgi:hypothetical protein
MMALGQHKRLGKVRVVGGSERCCDVISKSRGSGRAATDLSRILTFHYHEMWHCYSIVTDKSVSEGFVLDAFYYTLVITVIALKQSSDCGNSVNLLCT